MIAYMRPGTIAIPIAILILIVGLGDMPYGYYTFLRCSVCGVAIYAALLAHASVRNEQVRIGTTIALAAIAVVYNPLFPLRLHRSDWALINGITIAALVVTLIMLWFSQKPKPVAVQPKPVAKPILAAPSPATGATVSPMTSERPIMFKRSERREETPAEAALVAPDEGIISSDGEWSRLAITTASPSTPFADIQTDTARSIDIDGEVIVNMIGERFNTVLSSHIRSSMGRGLVPLSTADLMMHGYADEADLAMLYLGSHLSGNGTVVSLKRGTVQPLRGNLRVAQNFGGLLTAWTCVWYVRHLGAIDHGNYDVPNALHIQCHDETHDALRSMSRRGGDEPPLQGVPNPETTVTCLHAWKTETDIRMAALGWEPNVGYGLYGIAVDPSGLLIGINRTMVKRTNLRIFF